MSDQQRSEQQYGWTGQYGEQHGTQHGEQPSAHPTAPHEHRVIEGTVLGSTTDGTAGTGTDVPGYGYREDHSGGGFDSPLPPPPMPPTPPSAGLEGPEGPHGHGGRARRGMLRGRLVLVTAVAAIAAVLGGVTGGVIASQERTSDTRSTTIASPVSARSGGSADVAAIAAAVSPSVVQIAVKAPGGTATGTGVVLDKSGQILTNFHVISGAVDSGGQITVTFKDGSTTKASVTGTDKSLDVAVITASGVRNLTPATLGDSSTVAVGDPVVAIGNPDGLTGTVTSGIISAENREVTVQVDEGSTGGNGGYGFPFLPGLRGSQQQQPSGGTTTYKAFQTDAALNPGNSGGPLINANGQVIGINSAMYSPSGTGSTAGGGSNSAGSVGLGFAIPINDIKQVLPKLQAGQNV
ncbi:trypsin-like peptidase domain-containing protein [Streptomyces sp. SP17BM10]|uniref:S1C family serine protease n=1 Tax=Streptomyces sp. SP17BM10 TaxID=3002530 RepID=UPI002E7A7CD3|nr:trypsin-like peptidase domain-containing protein [Streptomyces sp. SP17BM10]MEE1789177.1 trypsin-like peptidase domain-containing protein [Streptomyces sp. SP17BM10]